MKYLFCIYDSKIPVYEELLALRSKAEAIRMFETTVQTKDNRLNKYPSDYSMFLIGEWDEETGLITSYPAPQHIASALEFVNSVDNVPLSAVN